VARNFSVLIIDPNLDGRLDVSRASTNVGFDVAGEAPYGTEATVQLTECKPNLVLLSVEDPPARALATLEGLRQLSPDTPVIAYSSQSTPALIRQAMRAGARDYLSKPMNADSLHEAAQAVLLQEEQRQLARWDGAAPATARGTVIAVAGAKGGIGKTTIATNLAVALRTLTQQEVAVVDIDAQFGDVAVMLDMPVERSIADLVRNEEQFSRPVVLDYLQRHSAGIDVLAAGSEPDDWRALQPEHVGQIIGALSETHEYALIDTPGTMNELVAAALNEAAAVLLVTSLEISSVKDTKVALKILEAWGYPLERVRLVVNDCNRSAAVSPEDAAEAAGLPLTTVIPYDSAVGPSVQSGEPLVGSHPHARFARSIFDLASTISGVTPMRERGAVPRFAAAIPLLGRGLA
jgi:pilus assembly protein CpaE